MGKYLDKYKQTHAERFCVRCQAARTVQATSCRVCKARLPVCMGMMRLIGNLYIGGATVERVRSGVVLESGTITMVESDQVSLICVALMERGDIVTWRANGIGQSYGLQ